VVAQPGVEFSDRELFGYRLGQAAHLREVLPAGMALEAHSTDYQRREALASLVTDGFAVLKVGPGLTFAYREAMLALAAIEDELLGDAGSGLRQELDAAMLADPRHWAPFYPGDERRAGYARVWSRSDRSRYYWPAAGVTAAVERLVANLDRLGIPDELASQFLPWLDGQEVPGASLGRRPSADGVRRAAVRRVLDVYAAATPQR
jgi:D-tagatose-1,6-bisphosphate aldolase subunit GatZ/KbaZ